MSEPFVYASELSPFGARIRIAVAVKRLPITFRPPPPGARSDERFAVTPLARFPVLIDGALRLVESLAILAYLDERYPDTVQLAPADPARRALDRAIALSFDNYVFPAMGPIFGQLTSAAPDPAIVAEALDRAGTAFGEIAGLFVEQGLALGRELSVADCAMAPFATLFSLLAQRFGARSPVDAYPRLATWFATAIEIDTVAATDERIRAAFAAAFGPAAPAQAGVSR